ncbi:ABC-2 transporter family protein [Clostridium argentinense CDC 2741]|uniref:ABC-2 transporter family protein n=1 Tax=Clostridium argentinense CDC 2741 TaxID=1418104 RepID=A0A0C1R2M9_9CLOT|nr:ABC transporter permease [Clostridium argentinense]KIE44696.1 ABC-2 transporter family protein [Clostridium argentinense CDC 2741]
MRTIILEFYKLRRKRILSMITIFIGAEILWAFMAISMSMSRNPESVKWEAIIAAISSMNGLFLPIISAIVASRICDMEHKGNTWKLLLSTNKKISHIYASKYLCSAILLCYGVIIQVIAILIFGIVKNVPGSIPIALLIRFIISTMLTNMAILALQQWISFSIKNQAFALCLGMIGGFLGMSAALFPTSLRRIFIWSYYTELSPVTYIYNGTSAEYIIRTINPKIIAIVLLMGIVFYVAGNVHVSKQEI